MVRAVVKWLGLLLSLWIGLQPQSGAAEQQDEEVLLFVSQDESSVERQIYAYINEAHGVRGDIDFYGDTTDDLVILYDLNPEGDAPRLTMHVDTIVTKRSDDGSVIERGIQVTGFHLLEDEQKDPELLSQILELNNRFTEDYWVPHQVYLDGDQDLIFSSIINIPGEEFPVHPELVWDLLVRSLSTWSEYYVQLQNILD